MLLRVLLRFLMGSLDVCLELLSVYAPDTTAPDLDGRELAGSHERVDLGDAHAQVSGHVLERHEARFDAAGPRSTRGLRGFRHPGKRSTDPRRNFVVDAFCPRLICEAGAALA